MKPKPERPVSASCAASAWRSPDDGRQVPPGFTALAPVRKEVRGVGVCAPAHIVDRIVWDPGVAKLKSNQRGEVAMGGCATSLDNRTPIRGVLHLASDFFADLERLNANVRTDRDNEIGRIV